MSTQINQDRINFLNILSTFRNFFANDIYKEDDIEREIKEIKKMEDSSNILKLEKQIQSNMQSAKSRRKSKINEQNSNEKINQIEFEKNTNLNNQKEKNNDLIR